MTLKERIHFLRTPEQVNGFLEENPNAALFKAGMCHKTGETLSRIESLLGQREDLPIGIVRVVEARPASNRVTEITGVRHESPQLFLFKDGKAVFNRDNWDITAEALEGALEDHFARV